MGIEKTTYTIRCDGCGIEQDFVNLMLSLKEAGWVCIPKGCIFTGKYYCKECKAGRSLK